jgi:condensin complex subunit 3
MPGKVSTGTSRNPPISHKASNNAVASRRSTASPTIIDLEGTHTSALRTQICTVFSDAQKATAGHRKLIVSLRKIQESCVYEPTRPGKENNQERDEDDFNVEIARCVIRLMVVKKSEGVGDRLVRFLGFFLRHASEKDAALVSESGFNNTSSFAETASTRLTSHILSILIPLLGSKEKNVRYRATQLVAHIINSLDSIDDEYYHLLKMGLLKKIRDKEPMIRIQAALGLGRLAGDDDDGDHGGLDSDDDGANGLLEKLLDVLQNDPSADVRRSLLLNLPLTPGTLPFLLERARDVDPATRRALYSRLLPALGDFRHLSLSMREKLLRWGLRDRDENVRKATTKLFRERWIADCVGPYPMGDGGDQPKATIPSIDGLLELLERIDVVNSGVEEGVALEAMEEFWRGRPDYQEAISFDDPFWACLGPEKIFLARTYNDYCRLEGDGKLDIMIEEKMPEVTKLAFLLQRYTNDLIESLRSNYDKYEEEEEEEEEDTIEQEFIVEQLLHIAKSLDYSDEVGRRKMFSLLRETLAIAELPNEITKLVVDVLRRVCGAEQAGEREFCGIVLEAVAEVHDAIAFDEPVGDNQDESFHSARSELTDTTPRKDKGPRDLVDNRGGNEDEDEAKAIKEIMINMKCLHIAQCMLQNVEGNMQRNLHLVTMLNNLVVPAVRSHEAPIRESGLVCLGLCCLLDKVHQKPEAGVLKCANVFDNRNWRKKT